MDRKKREEEGGNFQSFSSSCSLLADRITFHYDGRMEGLNESERFPHIAYSIVQIFLLLLVSSTM